MKHLRATLGGWQKHIRIDGKLRTEFTKARPTAPQVRQWVRRQHGDASDRHTPTDPDAVLFEDAAEEYLASVTAMPSYASRVLHIREWAAYFAGRDPDTITALEIRTRLHTLRTTYAASTCNHQRTALMSFYTSLNGKSGYNPVRDTEKFPEDEEPRAQTVWTIYRILALMPESQTRARLRVILWTGWPHTQLKKLKPAHLDLEHARAFVMPRRKGKGVKGKWLPLLPGAVLALKDFVKWDCFTKVDPDTGKLKPFSNSAMHSSFARAVSKLNTRRAQRQLPPLDVRPYDLRHTFGTFIATHTTDERAIQELMMHSRAEQTRRYTEGATRQRVADAIALIATFTSKPRGQQGDTDRANSQKP